MALPFVTTALESPTLKTKISLPPAPSKLSAPTPPVIVSPMLPPASVSLPPPPVKDKAETTVLPAVTFRLDKDEVMPEAETAPMAFTPVEEVAAAVGDKVRAYAPEPVTVTAPIDNGALVAPSVWVTALAAPTLIVDAPIDDVAAVAELSVRVGKAVVDPAPTVKMFDAKDLAVIVLAPNVP